MIDRESQHESSIPSREGLPTDPDEVSTVALPPESIPPLGNASMPAVDMRVGGSSVVRGGNPRLTPGSSILGGGTGSGTPGGPPALATDKTVISRRSPTAESALPPIPTPQTLGQTLIGKTLDHYELVEFVGGGGMGAVFRSVDTRLGRTVAVKVLSRDHTDEETIKRFRNEAQSAARLDHPNIARVYFVGEAEGWNYIVFEYIEGTNLRDIVETGGPLSLEDALNYTLQVAEALDHASHRDVVHRDIKPSNVLVTPGGQAKLVDMGLARLHQVESSSEDLTASGVMLGTFDYISPEQARDPRSADVRSDIYSLGCTLYFMLAGRPPFPEGTAVQKLLKHNSEEPSDLRLFRPEIPPPVTALVGKMLAKRPSRRQQSPRELIAEVLALAHQLGLTGLTQHASTTVTVLPPAASYWSRLLPIAVPIAALVLLLWLIDSLSRQGDGPQAFVQQPTFTGGKAKQSIGTEQTPIPADASTDKSTGSSVATGASEGSKAKGQVGAPAETDIVDATSAAATKTKEGSQINATNVGDLASGIPAATGASSSNDPGQGTGRSGSDSPAVGSTSRPPAATIDTQKQIQRLIVRRDQTDAPVPDDAEVVHSLSRACQIAAEHKVVKIELEFDGPLYELPFPLTMPRVEIVAAEKPDEAGSRYHPVIAFRPPPFGSDSDHQMIRLSGGSRSQVTFKGVELRLELPDEPSVGWSLLALYQLQSLDLTDSVLTVKCPGGAQGVVGYEPVAMLALQPYQPAEMMKMTDDMMAMLPSINVRLTNCIARGEATFLAAAEERPLSVVWNQGLLVTPLRLLETGGCKLMKPSSQDKLEVELTHVTAITPAGLVCQKRASGMPSHLRLEVTCKDSVIQWDRDNSLFSFEGLPSESDIKLRFTGSDNLYPPQPVFLQQKSVGGTPIGEPVAFEDIGKWGGNDLSADKIRWDSSPPLLADLPAHEHLPRHYVLEEGRFSGEGFDRNLLPHLEPSGSDQASPARSDAEPVDRPVSP